MIEKLVANIITSVNSSEYSSFYMHSNKIIKINTKNSEQQTAKTNEFISVRFLGKTHADRRTYCDFIEEEEKNIYK